MPSHLANAQTGHEHSTTRNQNALRFILYSGIFVMSMIKKFNLTTQKVIFSNMNMTKIQPALFLSLLCASSMALGRDYVIPPSTSTSSSAPWISDAAMEECVKKYNEGKWLLAEINKIYVDQYSEDSVNYYNSQVNRHSNMIDEFNRDCAGKQSESAYKAAKKLNQQQNL